MNEEDGSLPELERGEREIKVRIPVSFHLKLHTLKVLKGQSISSTVEKALERYFRDLRLHDEGRALEDVALKAIRELQR